jgi:nucleoside-diphosphate-sugar epimerase
MSEFAALRGARILVTGGAGMLGSTIAHMALDAGARVVVVDAMLPLYGGNEANLPSPQDGFRFVRGDIRDAGLMRELVADVDHVFSLAAQVSYVDADRDPFMDLDLNCRGHLTLLEACRAAAQRPRMIFASSRFVYGRVEYTPVDEKHPFNCLSMYGVHKLAGEKYYAFYSRVHDIPAVSLRIANPYGPRQQMRHAGYGIVNWFIRMALSGQPLAVYGDGAQVRDYIYVEDVARAFLAVAVSGSTPDEAFNVGSGVGTRFRDMVEMIADEIPGTNVVSVPWPPSRALVETGDYVSDVGRLHAATGWSPTVSLRDGIKLTADYYRERRHLYW